MSKEIKLEQFDAAIIFREDFGIEFLLSDGRPEDLCTKNIDFALTIFYLLQNEDPEFLKWFEEERIKTKKILTESHGKPRTSIH